jgi:hypothetical protein
MPNGRFAYAHLLNTHLTPLRRLFLDRSPPHFLSAAAPRRFEAGVCKQTSGGHLPSFRAAPRKPACASSRSCRHWHPTLIRRPESGVMVRRDEKHPLVLELGHSSHRVLIGHAHSPKNWPIASADRSTRVALSFKSSVHVWIYRTTSSHSDAALFAIIRCGISEQNSLSLGAVST